MLCSPKVRDQPLALHYLAFQVAFPPLGALPQKARAPSAQALRGGKVRMIKPARSNAAASIDLSLFVRIRPDVI
jgi:hypothetical protein